MSERGELVHAEALGDPREARLVGWTPQGHPVSDGPYAETTEHLAGFFVIDVATQERAEEIADWFAQPGGWPLPCWSRWRVPATYAAVADREVGESVALRRR